MTRNIQKWKRIISDDHYHPKLDDFICDEIIIHFWMIMYGNFHPFLDQEHTSQYIMGMSARFHEIKPAKMAKIDHLQGLNPAKISRHTVS